MGGQGLTRAGDALSDLLKLAADFLDLRKGRISGRSLGFELPKRLLRLLNLPLQGIILFLGDFTLLKLLVCLLRRRFQSGELFLGLLDGVCQQLLFLPYQFGVGRIKLQELLHVLQLCLGILNFLIDSSERSLVVSPPMDTVMPFRSRPPAMDHPSFLPPGIYSVKKGASG